MLWKSGNRRTRDSDTDDAPARPTALSLIGRIIMSLLNDGMQWLSIPAVVLLFYLHFSHNENDALAALIIVGLIIIALLRGCRAWQEDLQQYQRHLSLMRHRVARDQSDTIPGYFPSRR